MKTFSFDKKTRAEQRNSKEQIIQSAKNYFDFTISGQSMRTILNADHLDLITPLGWGDENYEQELIKEFIGEGKSQIPSGRLMIYVCPECGDIGCGCISVDLEITEDKVIWKNFGDENNDPDIDFESYKHVPSIEFDRADYMEKFKSLRT